MSGWWRRNAVALVLLAPALAGLWWVEGTHTRESWWVSQPHLAVGPGAGGWAEIAGTQIRLTGLERVELFESEWEDPWTPPAGYALWRAVVDWRTDLEETRYCTVELVDDQGRTFGVPDQAPAIPGVFAFGDLACGAPDPDTAMRHEVLYVLPEDAEPAALIVWTARTDELGLGPHYFRLPAP